MIEYPKILYKKGGTLRIDGDLLVSCLVVKDSDDETLARCAGWDDLQVVIAKKIKCNKTKKPKKVKPVKPVEPVDPIEPDFLEDDDKEPEV